MRWISSACVLLTLAAVAAAAASASRGAEPRTVTCDSVVTPSGEHDWRPKRVVLGLVAVPPRYVGQPEATGSRRWPYWLKSGLVVRAQSEAVLVSVPAAWRSRVAIGWGGVEAAATLRIAPCPPPGALGDWNPYAGGFLLRSRSACVPLEFTMGDRRAVVRFGIGRRCG
jgi:hypothetical protein